MGRANLETGATDGLAGRGRFLRRATPGAGGFEGSVFPWELGPGTRLRRSSSWVLSFAERVPTRDHTFSPTNVYASLWNVLV